MKKGYIFSKKIVNYVDNKLYRQVPSIDNNATWRIYGMLSKEVTDAICTIIKIIYLQVFAFQSLVAFELVNSVIVSLFQDLLIYWNKEKCENSALYIDLVLIYPQSMGKRLLFLSIRWTLSMQKRDGRPFTGVSTYFWKVPHSDMPCIIFKN
jgi:hypothetical protein